MTLKRDIPYYNQFISDSLLKYLLKQAVPVSGVDGLCELGQCSGLENKESLQFACYFYNGVKEELCKILEQRTKDRSFIDSSTTSCVQKNKDLDLDYLDDSYKTIIGLRDTDGRIVVGPKSTKYFQANGQDVAQIPEWLKPPHVTLFGPPNSAKMAINAMNTYHRKLKNEPEIVETLLQRSESLPKWGADDEDSKTPIRHDLMQASENLRLCFDGSLTARDDGREYTIARQQRSLPIKRIPGLALPSCFLFYHDNPLPLHIYDLALHLFCCWDNPQALVFYIPKLENEEEARYFKTLLVVAEEMIRSIHPEYQMGTIRLMIVLENPRAIFRTNEIIDELYPYFAGASLGWHDFLASTARLFKQDCNYRIPSKSDPDIVIKYIKASHELLANVVGKRGGIKVGGMYGVLPINTDLESDSFQVTMKGYIRDVITQLKRDLNGFWVAHPDFIRIGLALVQAWQEYRLGDNSSLEKLICSLLLPNNHREILEFVYGPDIEGITVSNDRFTRALLAADIKESEFMANGEEEEIRYNVFQTLQYITDWLSGNGCVALPATIEGLPVRVMDDLATAERSRWEVWHEIYHNRFSRKRLVDIVHEEMTFIKENCSNEIRQVQVKWDERTSKWYPVAMKLTLQLMTARQPVEFATELLLPFTLPEIQSSNDPWETIHSIDDEKFCFDDDIEHYINCFTP